MKDTENSRIAISIRDLYLRHEHSDFELNIEYLDIKSSVITIITGCNGSGKTTLLRIIAGFEKRHTAKIISNVASNTVYVHQKPWIFNDTVLDNAAYGLKLAAQRKAPHRIFGDDLNNLPRTHEDIAMECLELLGLSGLAHRKARTLSGGQRQRLAMARALAVKPALLILDEPTANTDKVSAQMLEKAILEMVRNGGTVLLATHDMALAYRIGDPLIRLDNGRMVPCNENVLSGAITGRDEYFNYFRTGDTVLHCPAISGDFSTAVIRMDDIIVSESPILSSAQNRLQGQIINILPSRIKALFRAEVRICEKSGLDGKTEGQRPINPRQCTIINALITGRSIEQMRLKIGSPVHLAFKASAIELY